MSPGSPAKPGGREPRPPAQKLQEGGRTRTKQLEVPETAVGLGGARIKRASETWPGRSCHRAVGHSTDSRPGPQELSPAPSPTCSWYRPQPPLNGTLGFGGSHGL